MSSQRVPGKTVPVINNKEHSISANNNNNNHNHNHSTSSNANSDNSGNNNDRDNSDNKPSNNSKDNKDEDNSGNNNHNKSNSNLNNLHRIWPKIHQGIEQNSNILLSRWTNLITFIEKNNDNNTTGKEIQSDSESDNDSANNHESKNNNNQLSIWDDNYNIEIPVILAIAIKCRDLQLYKLGNE